MVKPRIRQTVLDTTDIRSLAEFYRRLFDLRYRPGDEPPEGPDDADWLVLTDDDERVTLAFQVDPHHVAPTWPDSGVPQQMHLDTTVPDRPSLDAARDRALELGARLVLDRTDDPDEPLYVFLDPAGHPFCVFVSAQ